MEIQFTKISATGNDFIVIDNRNNIFSPEHRRLWQQICKRKTGIGANGVLLLEHSSQADFKMRYYNADGSEDTMCGNGGRAISYFAHFELRLKKEKEYQIQTMNGIYQAFIEGPHLIKLHMSELYDIAKFEISPLYPQCQEALFLNTGVPHAVFVVKNIDFINVKQVGKNIAHNKIFPLGSNVDFLEVVSPGKIKLRTFEVGVEDETLSCGTGATAAAITVNKLFGKQEQVEVQTIQDKLIITFDHKCNNIFLSGRVNKIFNGSFIY